MKELPGDLLIEIAQRLPAQSIGRFRSVSKQWNFILSSPEFVKSHRRHAPERIILRDYLKPTAHVITLATDVSSGSSRAVQSPTLRGTVSVMLRGCCDGLALLSVTNHDFEESLVLINPMTCRDSTVPMYKTPRNSETRIGFGMAEDGYKIALCWNSETSTTPTTVMIFSLNTRKWQKCADHDMHLSKDPGVYADGRLYWVANGDRDRRDFEIVAFDLSTEKFQKVPLPDDFELCLLKNARLKLLGGHLALLMNHADVDEGRQIYVWIMEKPSSWRKLIRIDNVNYPLKRLTSDSYDVVSRLGEFEFVLVRNSNELVAYNCETGVWRNLDIDGLPGLINVFSIFTFRESLVFKG